MTTANAAYWMGFTRDVLTALAILVGAYLAVTLYAKLRPRFILRILSEWVGDRLVLRYEIENKSAAYAAVEHAYVEILDRTLDLQPSGFLPHQVVFSREPATEIFETTTEIYPGEIPAVEQSHAFPGDQVVVQVGLQVKLRRKWWHFKHQQTTTRFVVKPLRLG